MEQSKTPSALSLTAIAEDGEAPHRAAAVVGSGSHARARPASSLRPRLPPRRAHARAPMLLMHPICARETPSDAVPPQDQRR